MTHKQRTNLVSKPDIVVFVILALIGVVMSVWIFLPKQGTAVYLDVRQNGTVIMTLPLSIDTVQTIPAANGGINTFQIKDQTVTMLDADCGDHTCINTGTISRTGESIVCLPHRLVLQITSASNWEEDAAPDAIVH